MVTEKNNPNNSPELKIIIGMTPNPFCSFKNGKVIRMDLFKISKKSRKQKIIMNVL